jgi:pimeloyl-ACP methyl ester carboxylesterase/DNA-binding SARP family transcriptional activator
MDVGGRTLRARDFGGVKPKQILEILLIERGRPVSKFRLAQLVWGDDLPANVAGTIEGYVSQLRRRFGDGLPDRPVIATEHGAYRLVPDSVAVDLDEFDATVRSAAAAAGVADRRRLLDAAWSLGSREVLADEPEATWALPPRAHYRELAVQVGIDLAECCLVQHDYPSAARAAASVLTRVATNERATRAAMRAHYALGDRDAALLVHDRCRQALADELGVDPTAATNELLVAILRDSDPESLVPRSSAQSGSPGFAVRYADGRTARIAYQVVGDGPVDLVFAPSFVTNLGASWSDPTYSAFLHRLAEFTRLIVFDKRGTGLSDPALDFPTQQERSDDLLAVLDGAESARAVLFGSCAGGALCANFAADHPERTSGLVLFGAFARLLRTADYPWGWPPSKYQAFLDSFEQTWLSGGDPGRRNPGIADDPRYQDWYVRYLRLAANPFMSRRLAEMNADIDIRRLLPTIQAPTLVVVRNEDAWLAPANSAYLASQIPDARLVELPGRDHDPWIGDVEPVMSTIREFVADVEIRIKTAASR